jgi:hypothetical protein
MVTEVELAETKKGNPLFDSPDAERFAGQAAVFQAAQQNPAFLGRIEPKIGFGRPPGVAGQFVSLGQVYFRPVEMQLAALQVEVGRFQPDDFTNAQAVVGEYPVGF